MTQDNTPRRSLYTTRRDFLKASATVSATSALLTSGNYAFAQGDSKIRVGLVGCGGRGTGAANDCITSSENVELVAMGDLFKDRLDGSRNQLKEQLKDKFKVADDHCFSGFDAIDKVLKTDINLIILA